MRSATLTHPRVDHPVFAQLVDDVAQPLGFASTDDVESMRLRLQRLAGTRTGADVHGQRAYLRLSPGTVGLRVSTVMAMDLNDGRQASDDLAVLAAGETEREGVVDDLVLFELEEPGRRITEWSRRSRARMAERIAELDYSGWADDGGVLGMVTFTLAGPWEQVAPCGRTFKQLIDRMRKRYIEAKDENGKRLVWRGLWKLEFQERGAPHLHTLMRIPAMVNGERYENWLAQTWADVVLDSIDDPEFRAEYLAAGHYRRHLGHGTDVAFSGVKFSDPRRTAIYFSKHSAKTVDNKEYQHIVPELWREDGKGPGRFWGYWALDRATAEVEVDWAAFVAARRVLRHVARARRAVTEMNRLRAAGDAAGVWSMRRPGRRGGFGASGGGWVLVNDGLALAWDVGRFLDARQN